MPWPQWGRSFTALRYGESQSMYQGKERTSTLTYDSNKSIAGALRGVISFRKGFSKFVFSVASRNSAYTPNEIERTIYDNVHHDGKPGLLMGDDIINVEEEEEAEELHDPEWMLRCRSGWPCKLADILLLVSVLGTILSTPLTFFLGGSIEDPSRVPGQYKCLYFDIAMDCMYASCLLLKLNMSFIHPKRRVEVVQRSKILKRWLRDPVYWLQWFSVTSYPVQAVCGLSLLYNNVKIVRLVYLIYLPDSLWQFQERWVLRISRPYILLNILSHWMGCLLSCLGGYRDALESGEVDFTTVLSTIAKDYDVSPYWSIWFKSFIEACYLLTGMLDNPLGEGTPRQGNFGSLVIVAFFGPIGCVISAMFLATIVREYTLKHALEQRHSENKAFMRHALENLNIPHDLQTRVLSLHYYQKCSHDHEAIKALFNHSNISPALALSLRVYLYQNMLISPYFCGKDFNYVIEVIRVLEDRVFLPGDYVTRRGEVGESMYFVGRGELSVLVPNALDMSLGKAMAVATKERGDYFGEIALIKDCVRTAWVRADSYVLVSMLMRAAVQEVWKYFPQERTEMRRMVTDTAKKDRKRAAEQLHEVATTILNGNEVPGADTVATDFDAAKLLDNLTDSLQSPPRRRTGAHLWRVLAKTVGSAMEIRNVAHEVQDVRQSSRLHDSINLQRGSAQGGLDTEAGTGCLSQARHRLDGQMEPIRGSGWDAPEQPPFKTSAGSSMSKRISDESRTILAAAEARAVISQEQVELIEKVSHQQVSGLLANTSQLRPVAPAPSKRPEEFYDVLIRGQRKLQESVDKLSERQAALEQMIAQSLGRVAASTTANVCVSFSTTAPPAPESTVPGVDWVLWSSATESQLPGTQDVKARSRSPRAALPLCGDDLLPEKPHCTRPYGASYGGRISMRPRRADRGAPHDPLESRDHATVVPSAPASFAVMSSPPQLPVPTPMPNGSLGSPPCLDGDAENAAIETWSDNEVRNQDSVDDAGAVLLQQALSVARSTWGSLDDEVRNPLDSLSL